MATAMTNADSIQFLSLDDDVISAKVRRKDGTLRSVGCESS